MDNIFNYIPEIYCIRTKKYLPFASKYIQSSSLFNLHKQLLSNLADQNVHACMVFENEIYLIRELLDVNNNEIKDFIMTNTDWDMLIIGQNNIQDITPVQNFSRIFKFNDSTQLLTSYVYIASYRLLNKIKNNNRSDLSTYIYSPTFISNIEQSSSSTVKNSDHYMIGHVTDITSANMETVKYKWTPINWVFN